MKNARTLTEEILKPQKMMKDYEIADMLRNETISLEDAVIMCLQTRFNPKTGWGKQDIMKLHDVLCINKNQIERVIVNLVNRNVIHWCHNIKEYRADSELKCSTCAKFEERFGIKVEKDEYECVFPSSWENINEDANPIR